MQKVCNILLLCLVLGLPWNALGNIHSSFSDRETAHLRPLENTSSQAQPKDNANRFRIPHQAESGIDILTRLANPDSLNEISDPSSGTFTKDSYPTNHAPFYFSIAQNIERSLTTKKIIFPFHTFL